jgi:hypothetical protein
MSTAVRRWSRVPGGFAAQALAVGCGLIAAGPASANANGRPPVCDPGTRPAVVFDGLPARMSYGEHQLFGLQHNVFSSATVPGMRVRVEMVERGRAFYTDYTTKRDFDLYEVWFGLQSRHAHVDLTYTEKARRGNRCRRHLVKHIALYRDWPRFRAFAAPPGYSRASRYTLGETIRYVLFDRFTDATRYRLCLRHLASGRRSCVSSRTREPRRPARVIQPAPGLGWWRAIWLVRGRPVQRFAFHVGIGDLGLSLGRYWFESDVGGRNGQTWRFDWAVTVCTPMQGRIRVKAHVFDDFRRHETFLFRRRQPAGCKRHRLHTLGGDSFEEGGSYSFLQVSWNGRQRLTQELDSTIVYPK